MNPNALLLSTFAAPPVVVDAADFDGTNDVMTRGGALTGAGSSSKGIISVWLRIDGGDGTTRRFFNGLNAVGGEVSSLSGFRVGLNSSNEFSITLTQLQVNSNVRLILSASTYSAGAAWRHLLLSFDTTIGAPVEHLYVDDADDLGTVFPDGEGTLSWTMPDWAIGGASDISPLTGTWNGAIAELYVAVGQFLDFSVESNRRKFITADGKPANLLPNGAGPTGVRPLVYSHLLDGEAASNFAANRGTGGDFSITGSLDTASSSPSD